MTREEAKEILTHNWTRVDNPNYSESELDEAFFMAIEALQGYEEVKAYADTLVDAFIEDGEELAESVKVVRCKDCRWYDNRYGDVCHNPRYGDGWANYPPPYVDEDYWCKDGEGGGEE